MFIQRDNYKYNNQEHGTKVPIMSRLLAPVMALLHQRGPRHGASKYEQQKKKKKKII